MIDDLVSWIKSQAEIRNKSAVLIELDYTIPSMVNALLAKKTGLAVHAVFICDAKWHILRDFCEYLNIDYTRASYSIPYISDFMPEIDEFQDKRIVYKNDELNLINLEKNIRISYISETTNSLALSNITRDDYLFIRNYHKLNPYDIMPFANLSMTMINDIFDKLVPIKSEKIQAIYDIAPKYNPEMEWLYSINERIKIIESDLDPTKNLLWYTYTTSQKTLIAKVHQIEKLSRYKENSNIPIFKITNET